MNSLYSTLMEVLKQKAEFFSENGELLRNAVYETAMKVDPSLIKVLLSNETTKKLFFTEIDGVLVFDKVGFGWVINNKEFLPDSYTRFKNKTRSRSRVSSILWKSIDTSLPLDKLFIENCSTIFPFSSITLM